MIVQASSTTTSRFTLPCATHASFSWSTNFNSSSELAAALLRLGKNFNVLQLSQGRLQGHFSVVHLKDLSIFSIQTNQLLLLNGERGKDSIAFSLETSGVHDDHRIYSRSIEPYSLHGFKPDLQESHFQLTAGSTSVIAITSARKFGRFLEHFGQTQLLEILHTSNSLQLQPEHYLKISRQLLWHLNNPLKNSEQRSLHTKNIFALMLEVFTGTNLDQYSSFRVAPRQQLVCDLIDWGFDNSTQPHKLDDISNILLSSRRTLILGCKENFQKGPMELLRLIRLEQVNYAIRSDELRNSLGLHKIGDIADHFGFTSRGHFSASYQRYFGETPRQTLADAKHQRIGASKT